MYQTKNFLFLLIHSHGRFPGFGFKLQVDLVLLLIVLDRVQLPLLPNGLPSDPRVGDKPLDVGGLVGLVVFGGLGQSTDDELADDAGVDGLPLFLGLLLVRGVAGQVEETPDVVGPLGSESPEIGRAHV